MITPEFRYLLVQEEHIREMMLIDSDLFGGIFICGTIGLVLISIIWITNKLFSNSDTLAKYFWSALWDSLTPGNEWFDLTIIISTLIYGIVMMFALKCIYNCLDKGFTKLKNENNKKDDKIRELEFKIASLEAVSTSAEQNINKN